MRYNTEKINKIMLYLFIIEETILLLAGVYNLVKDTSIIIPSLVILIIAYFISLLKTKITRINELKETRTFKKKIIIWIMIVLFSMILSMLRKRILEKYFIGQQITVLVIWFLIGIVTENIIVLAIKRIKIKRIAIPLNGSAEEML